MRIVGLGSDASGIGRTSTLALRALEYLGLQFEFWSLADLEGGRSPADASPWIFLLNPPELSEALLRIGPASIRGPKFGFWAWELPEAPKPWTRFSEVLDEVWAPSRYTAASMSRCSVPVRVVPLPFVAADYDDFHRNRAEFGWSNEDFILVSILDVNSSIARKNPFAVVDAFERAFSGDQSARLVLKVRNGALLPGFIASFIARAGPQVSIIDEEWPHDKVMRLIASADVLVSLHRAEGFGLTMAEAMMVGTAVVATGWSGNMDFMDCDSAEIVGTNLTPVDDPQGVYKGQAWADPIPSLASQALVRVRSDPYRAKAMARAAKARVRSQLSPEAWYTSLGPSFQTLFCDRSVTLERRVSQRL